MLAASHWEAQNPKFNTAAKKEELMLFAESILDKCGVPEVGFGKEGIAEHIQAYFNEQRRYQKRGVRFEPLYISDRGMVQKLFNLFSNVGNFLRTTLLNCHGFKDGFLHALLQEFFRNLQCYRVKTEEVEQRFAQHFG